VNPRSTVPVVAITGPLGVGKTSLVNALLRTPGARIGVVVNDFGAVNIDAGLVVGQIDEAASISGGCICCLDDTSGLDDALERLTDARLALDVVLVEASGAADPAVLSRLIRFSSAPRARWGGLVEVVDAAWFARTTEAERLGDARYRTASLVVANKTDRTPDADRVLRALGDVAPRAVVVSAVRGAIDPTVLFDVAERAASDELDFSGLTEPEHMHHHAEAVTCELHTPVSADALVDLLDTPVPGVARIKGIVDVRIGSASRPYVVHVVTGTVHVEPLGTGTAARALVAIGYGFDAEVVRARFESVAVDEPSSPAGVRRLRRLLRLSR